MEFCVGLFVGLGIGGIALSFATDNPQYTRFLSFATGTATIIVAVCAACMS